METLFWTIVGILLVIWFIGFFIGLGNFIHILLVVAAVVIVYRLVTGRDIFSKKEIEKGST